MKHAAVLAAALTVAACQARADLIPANDPRISTGGRVDASVPGRVRLAYPGTAIRFRFEGTGASLALDADSDSTYLAIIVDGGEPKIVGLPQGASDLVVASGLDAGPHTIEVVKRTETWQGILTFKGVDVTGILLEPPAPQQRKLLFIGDSVTCGTGVDNYPTCELAKGRSSNGYDTYGMVLGRRLKAEVHLVCYGGRGVVRDYRGLKDILNGPQFFHYSVPSDDAQKRAPWSGTKWVPDAIVVSLGTNDWNLQKKDPLPESEFVVTYANFLSELARTYPSAVLLATQGAIVTDPLLGRYIQAAVARAANDHIRWFESRHYPGAPCDAHPDLPQHRQMADDIEPVLRQALGW